MPKKKKKPLPDARHRELIAAWERLKACSLAPLELGARAKGVKSKPKTRTRSVAPQYDIPPDRDVRLYPSRSEHRNVAARRADKEYTGDKMLGVAVLHKSNGVPVFRNEDIIDIAKMRRN